MLRPPICQQLAIASILRNPDQIADYFAQIKLLPCGNLLRGNPLIQSLDCPIQLLVARSANLPERRKLLLMLALLARQRSHGRSLLSPTAYARGERGATRLDQHLENDDV